MLLVGQSVLLALGALPVLGIARQRLQDERPAAAFVILYLLNPSLHGINVRDFHAAALAIPLLLAAIYLAEVGRPWLFVLATVLTLMCREGAALPVMGLGVWLALSRHRWLAGGAVALGALTLLAVDVRWIIPIFAMSPTFTCGAMSISASPSARSREGDCDLGNSIVVPWPVPLNLESS